MNDLFVLACLSLALIASVLPSLVLKRFRPTRFLIWAFLAGVFAILHFRPDWVFFADASLVRTIYDGVLLLALVLFSVSVRRKIKVTQNLTDYDFFEMEKELDEIKNSSELLRLRFIATIDLLHQGLFFYNDDLSGLFLSDRAMEILGVDTHEWTIEDYALLIHPEDKGQYLTTLKKISKKTPSFDLKYRVKHSSGYVWIEEKAKIFESDAGVHVLSAIQGIDMKLFPLTTLHEIDTLPAEPQLIQTLSQAFKEPETFYLVMIHLTNLPEINQRFGRDVGNLLIADYVKKIKYHFAKDVNSVFRVTGIQFALVIREARKYDVLLRALQSGGDLVNLQLSIGGIQQVVYPNLGIAKHEPWSAYGIPEFITMANKALEEALRNPKRNYAIFGE